MATIPFHLPTKHFGGSTSFGMAFNNGTYFSMAWGPMTYCDPPKTVEVMVSSEDKEDIHTCQTPDQVAALLAEAAGLRVRTPEQAAALQDIWICSGLLIHTLVVARERDLISEHSFKECLKAVRAAAAQGDPLPID
jgi:hypothetical protein